VAAQLIVVKSSTENNLELERKALILLVPIHVKLKQILIKKYAAKDHLVLFHITNQNSKHRRNVFVCQFSHT
jgi:hypothetical protein